MAVPERDCGTAAPSARGFGQAVPYVMALAPTVVCSAIWLWALSQHGLRQLLPALPQPVLNRTPPPAG
jgi:hypothetical protein